MPNTIDLSILLIRKRFRDGLTQEAAAERLDMKRSKYVWLERDREPRIKDIKRLCKFLGITPNDLFKWEQ